MQKRTHKLRGLGNVAAVVAKAPSLSAAAKQLGVNRSTLHRWLEAGKVSRPAAKRGSAEAPEQLPAGQSAEAWASTLQAEHVLTETQRQLVGLAQAALDLAQKATETPHVRLAAMGRFQQLVRQLNLEAVAQPQQQPARQEVRRTGTDPRALLMAVK